MTGKQLLARLRLSHFLWAVTISFAFWMIGYQTGNWLGGLGWGWVDLRPVTP